MVNQCQSEAEVNFVVDVDVVVVVVDFVVVALHVVIGHIIFSCCQ